MMDVKDIMKLIPHRFPFLLIDRITYADGETISAIKNVTINEPFFQGHFPSEPIMPGVLIVEAMAQAAGVLAQSSGAGGTGVLFLSIEKAKFRKMVVPGDQIKIEVKVLQKRNNVWKFTGKALVEDKAVCEAGFTAMITGQEG